MDGHSHDRYAVRKQTHSEYGRLIQRIHGNEKKKCLVLACGRNEGHMYING